MVRNYIGGIMAKWEFAIAVRDEVDLPSGHKRKKEGDIIAVKPHPWQWGKREVNVYLIVIADNLIEQEAHSLCQAHYEDGILQENINIDNPVDIVGKRRYSIPLSIIKNGWIPKMIIPDVRDLRKIYQPLKNENIVIDFSERVSICKDKHSGKFKYNKKKIKE